MKVIGDIESVNLSTGERSQRVSGDGESRRVPFRGMIDVARLGPSDEMKYGPREFEPTVDEIIERAKQILKGATVHYRNGREAKNGDKIIQIGDRYNPDGSITKGVITGAGVLYDAKPGNDHCNGSIAPFQQPVTGACLCDCLHIDDVAALLAEKGLDKRPAGK